MTHPRQWFLEVTDCAHGGSVPSLPQLWRLVEGCSTDADADQLLEGYVAWLTDVLPDRLEPWDMAAANIRFYLTRFASPGVRALWEEALRRAPLLPALRVVSAD